MKKYLILLMTLFLIAGCGQSGKEQFLAKINNYVITPAEFEQEFRDSPYGNDDTIDSRRIFLEQIINRQLILQDAQHRGIDKDKSFLKMIERFWEQSLLKLTLDRISREISGSVQVSDREIKEAYEKKFSEGKTDKSYAQAYNNIKSDLIKTKETRLMNEWLGGLYKKAKIEINYGLLNNKSNKR